MSLPLTIESVRHVVSTTFRITSPPVTETLSGLDIKYQELQRLQRNLMLNFNRHLELHPNLSIEDIYIQLLIQKG